MVPTASPGLFFWWPGWRNGRRKGLKIPREKSHVGSIPTPGTGFSAGLWPSSMGWQHTYISSRNVRITPEPRPRLTVADAFELGQFARGLADLNTSACV